VATIKKFHRNLEGRGAAIAVFRLFGFFYVCHARYQVNLASGFLANPPEPLQLSVYVVARALPHFLVIGQCCFVSRFG